MHQLVFAAVVRHAHEFLLGQLGACFHHGRVLLSVLYQFAGQPAYHYAKPHKENLILDSTPDQIIWNIAGDSVALGPIRRDLLPLYQKWMNDFQTTRNLTIQANPLTLDKEQGWYERASLREGNPTFTIYEKSTGRAIGNTGLEFDFRNRTGNFGICIGEADCRGKGYGTEATRLVLDFAFTAHGIHNVMLTVYEFNRGAIRCYEKAGFKEFGRRRQCLFMGGRMWDIVYMDCLATEFESPLLARGLNAGL
jgi:diamine N-acetyltransferase